MAIRLPVIASSPAARSTFSLMLRYSIILLISILITIASYAIVTRRNVLMDPKAAAEGQHSLTGQYLVTLPCVPASGDYDSGRPRLPEARGLPFNYNYYNPCDGHQILREGFLKDVGFWVIFSGVIYGISSRTRQTSKRKDY